jgi:UDP-N-acetylglucosamine 2-epimerase (non-hydrolysing)
VAEIERRGVFRQQVVDLCPPDSRPSDAALAAIAFPVPRRLIEPGTGAQGERTGKMLAAFERVLLEDRPSLVVLAGDFDATLAAALAAVKLGVSVARLEAGLRSWDWTSGEEINRVLTDRLSDVLFTQSPDAEENLRAEGIPYGRAHFVGSTMVDWLHRCAQLARGRAAWRSLGLAQYSYVMIVLHRRATVDGPDRAARLVDALDLLASRVPVVLLLAPRTAGELAAAGVTTGRTPTGLCCVGPLAFLDFLSLAGSAGAIVTDSGNVQEEASALGVPCYTLRDTTERAVTLTFGTNTLLGDDPGELVEVAPSGQPPTPCVIPGWDGRASKRVVDVLAANFALRGERVLGR